MKDLRFAFPGDLVTLRFIGLSVIAECPQGEGI